MTLSERSSVRYIRCIEWLSSYLLLLLCDLERCGEHLEPVAVGILDEVETHSLILKTYPPSLAMVLADLIVVAIYLEADMKLALTQVVWLAMVAKVCELQCHRLHTIAQVDDLVVAIGVDNSSRLGETQSLTVEG